MRINYSLLLIAVMIIYSAPIMSMDSGAIDDEDLSPREREQQTIIQTSDNYIQAHNRYKSIIKAIREGTKSVNYVDESGMTALHMAVIHGTLDDVQFIVNGGANLENNAKGILSTVSDRCYPQKLSFLLQHGVSPDYGIRAGEHHFYLIHWATAHDVNMECLRILIENNANVNLADSMGENAYFYARSKEAVELLYEAGADLFHKNIFGVDAVHRSILMNKEDIFIDVIVKEMNKKRETYLKSVH